MPKDRRPRLYLYGLSLGAMNTERSNELFEVLGDPYQGVLLAGPPFPSNIWHSITERRNEGSPFWLPRFRDGSYVRFTSQENALAIPGAHWGPMRIVYLQYASDPITFFDPLSFYRSPDWMAAPRTGRVARPALVSGGQLPATARRYRDRDHGPARARPRLRRAALYRRLDRGARHRGLAAAAGRAAEGPLRFALIPRIYKPLATCEGHAMIELVRTNDVVVISFVRSLMRDAGIACFVADQNMSVMDGSLGILSRRVMVDAERADEARQILTDAGMADEMRAK